MKLGEVIRKWRKMSDMALREAAKQINSLARNATEEEAVASAEPIIRAVNNFDALVEALWNAKRCLERPDRSQLSVRKAIEKADAVLASEIRYVLQDHAERLDCAARGCPIAILQGQEAYTVGVNVYCSRSCATRGQS